MSAAQTEKYCCNEIPRLSIRNLIAFIYNRGYKPIAIKELMHELGVTEKYQKSFSRILKDLADNGIIVKLKRKQFARCTNAQFVMGLIKFFPDGSAVVKDSKEKRSVYIHRRKTGRALVNDDVLVRIVRRRSGVRANNLAQGEVVQILRRNCSTIVGTLTHKSSTYFVKPHRNDIQCTIDIDNPKMAKSGDRVVVRLLDWDRRANYPSGTIVEVIGPAEEPTLDTIAVIKAYDLPSNFPGDVIQQTEGLSIQDADLNGRLDLRKKFIFTIDPITAKDFDDAISLEKKKNGTSILGVHIADVSHFIPINSPLDKEATKRGNSVYFPDTVIPMLPESLSNDLCSLRKDAMRLTVSVLITLDVDAHPLKVEFHESMIKSRLRLNYGQVQQALNSANGEDFPEAGLDKAGINTLRHLYQISQKLRERRFENGSLNMNIPEIQFSFNTNGQIEDINPTEHEEAHHLIEECMLLANEMVCKQLSQKGIPHLYRIHEEPDPEKIEEVEDMLRATGQQVGDLTVRKNLCSFLSSIANSPPAHAWNVAILRSMKKAEYSEKAVGHFGLAMQHYTHFTSPIRRYSDLVVHRILKAFLRKKKPIYSRSRLSEIARRCTEREVTATQVEREVKDTKIIRYFFEQIKSGRLKEYQAVVVDVRNHGLFIDIPQVQAYGMIHKSMLGDGVFFDSLKKGFFSRHKNAKIFKIGLSLKVVISRINLQKKFLDFVPVNSKLEFP